MGEVTNEVIVERIGNLKDHVSSELEHVSKELSEIKEQTKKTNGRVSTLERWRSYLAGGMAVILILIPIFLKFF